MGRLYLAAKPLLNRTYRAFPNREAVCRERTLSRPKWPVFTCRTKLSSIQRTIFVQRAVLGWDNAAAARLLGKTASGNWQPRQVGEIFRQALCSLATSLAHSAAVGA